MSKPSPTNRPKRVITWDEIAAELLSQEVNKDLSQTRVQEVKPQLMRWAVLSIIVGWIFLSTAASALLFLLTRSNIALAPLSIAMATTPSLMKIIFRFLFWGPDDYRLEMLKLTLKAKEKEWKYSRRSH